MPYRKPTDEEWELVKAEWEQGASYKFLSNKHSIPETTIKDRARTLNWILTAKTTRKKTVKLPEVTWKRIEESYVKGSMSPAAIVARYGVSKRTLEHRSNKGEWFAKRQAFNKQAKEMAEGALKEKVDALVKHGTLAADILDTVPSLLSEIQDSININIRSRVETLKSLVEATDRAVRMERLAHGLKDGEASAKKTKDDDGYKFIVKVGEDKPDKVVNIKPLQETDEDEFPSEVDLKKQA